MKRTIKSISDFTEYINETLKNKSRIPKTYGKYVASYVSAFTMVMKTSRGRDKICSVFQYTADLYYACNKYSEIPEIRERFLEGLSTSVQIAYKTKASMKSARKIFKFLKFIDELHSLAKLADSKKPKIIIILKLFAHIATFFHNIVDNLLWGVNIGVLSSVFDQPTYKRWKAMKHTFSLIRIIFKLLLYNFSFQIRSKDVREVLVQLRPLKDQIIGEETQAHELCLEYLKQRSELRFQILDSVLMTLRVVMLVRRLKLPGHKYVTSILHAACGLISTILSSIKMLMEQPVLLQIQKEDQPAKQLLHKDTFDSVEPAKRLKFTESGLINSIKEEQPEDSRLFIKRVTRN